VCNPTPNFCVNFNRGKIKILSAYSPYGIIGQSADTVILDNIEDENLYKSVIPLLSASKNPKLIVCGTALSSEGVIYKLFSDNNNVFNKTKMTWRDVPSRNQDWKKEMQKLYPKSVWDLEMELKL
jgi:hypothetical protein